MIGFDETVEIAVPVRTAYDQWTQFASFPRFMTVVKEVGHVRPNVTRWVLGIGPLRHEFHAETLEQHPDSRVSWRSLGRRLRHEGEVSFQSVGTDRSQVTVRVSYSGRIAFGTGPVLVALTRRVVRSDLRRFATFIEGVSDAGESWRGTIHRGRVLDLQQRPSDSPDWVHG